MVTIVNKQPHPSVVKQAICQSCGTTLEYVPNEVKSETHREYGGGSDTYYHIKCPNCSEKVGVRSY